MRCGVRRGSTRPTVVLEVADTGPGIAEAVRESIFEPFVTTKRHGAGLGLALCRAVVDVHRGTIRAANRTPGPGAVFTVEFPAEPAPPPGDVGATGPGLDGSSHLGGSWGRAGGRRDPRRPASRQVTRGRSHGS